MISLLFAFLAHSRRVLHSLASLMLLLVTLVFSISWGAASPMPDEPGAPPLFLNLLELIPALQPTPPPPSRAAKREHLAQVDLELLVDAERNQALQINLFDDVRLTAERMKAGPAYDGGYVWVGRVPGRPFSAVILARVNEAVAGVVMDGRGQTYEIRYAGGGRHVLRQLDTLRFPEEAPSLLPPATSLVEAAPAANSDAVAALTTDDSSRLDIMIVYSDDARIAAGGTNGMLSEVYLAVELTNLSYINSNVVQRLSLVYTTEIAYSETGNSSTDLDRLYKPSDGQIDQVPTLRDRYGADLVTFLLDDLDYCGRGFVMDNISTGFAPYAYNVVARDCASSNLSMAHELGHNMGGQHDWYVEDTKLPYSYAHGYLNVAEEWRTVMAYNSECGAQVPAVSCTRIPYFSNPSISYDGNPTGVFMGTNTSCVEGDLSHPACDADMRTTLNNTAATVAEFRATSPGRSDVWMKDTWEDTGAEPDANTASQDLWLSPYLWVRTTQDVNHMFQHEHQNPIKGATNYVYAKLHNGKDTSVSGTLLLYWANQAAGLEWYTDWAAFATIPVTLPANSSRVLEATWVPEGSGHYCLLARFVSEADPIHAESAVVSENVRNNNNIIWKNVHVVGFSLSACDKEQLLPLYLRNVGNLAGSTEVEQIDLILKPAAGLEDEWLNYFSLLGLTLDGLSSRVASSDGFQLVPGTNLLQLVDATGGRLRLNLKYREEGLINVFTKADCENFPAMLTNLVLNVEQIAVGDPEPVGGVTYLINLEPPANQMITITGSKFNDRNHNTFWDEDGSEPPLARWEIRALNLQGIQYTAITDLNGGYRLELPPGIYTIYEVQQPGWVQTAPVYDSYALDLSQALPGSTVYNIDFGNFQPDIFLPLILLSRW